ncbi:MAG: sulfite exporter TauE/SafE family protein, partial [Gammaproteobacteria bacterium]|nr:sulfite exporter TauE/SafE family protein [Gammaproteobacteria bacterium]
MTGDEPGMLAVALVAFGAGLIRGFTGFGGPAFILAILTLFFAPV